MQQDPGANTIEHTAKRIGVLGGSFDPVHLAHLLVAETVRESLLLDFVLFVPAGIQPLKQAQPSTSAEHRVAMVELALADNPRFKLSSVDVDRVGPSYTVDTVRQLRAEWGGAGLEMWFIVGADSLLSLPRWHQAAGILQHTRLAAVARPGVTLDMPALEAQLPGVTGAVDIVGAPLIEVSATDIRRRVSQGRSIQYRVPASVAAYIESHGLYR